MESVENFEARYLSGQKLWGDDFTDEELVKWFNDEAEAYASLTCDGVEYAAMSPDETYGFKGFNEWYGFRHLPEGSLGHVLAFGGSDGRELAAVAERSDSITVVEPSQQLRRESVGATRVAYVTPVPSGKLPFEANYFGLITCFGVLHHIANVSTVMSELARVASPGATLLLREPVVSMGDWRRPRAGLTFRERGIPPHLLERAITASGFVIERAHWCDFPSTRRLSRLHPSLGYGSTLGTVVDDALSRLTRWNHRYHATRMIHKLRPISRFYVASRR
jgi:SAM-dependent methyltransferase